MEPTTPESGVVDEASAFEKVSSLLNDDDEPEIVAEDPEVPEEEAEASEEAETEPQEEEEEPSEEASIEDFDELAKALELDPTDLAGNLKVTLKNGDKTTVAELIRGHLREADYTRKRQADAAEQKAFQEKAAAAQAQLQQKLESLDRVLADFQPQRMSPEEMERLLDEDPQEYLRIKLKEDSQIQKYEEAQRERDRQIQELTAQQQKVLMETRKAQQDDLVKRLPHLKDPQKLAKFESQMTEYLVSKGATKEMVASYMSGPFNALDVDVIHDAMKYRALEAGKKDVKKIKNLPKVQIPGATAGKKTKDDLLAAASAKIKNAKSTTSQRAAAVDYVKNLI